MNAGNHCVVPSLSSPSEGRSVAVPERLVLALSEANVRADNGRDWARSPPHVCRGAVPPPPNELSYGGPSGT